MQMYGKITLSWKKRLIVEGLKTGKNFDMLAEEQSINKGTAEVYGIEGLAAGEHIDHEMLAKYLDISCDSFKRIKREILSSEDRKLRTIRDKFFEEFTYNQIRFVLACLIQELDV